MSSEVGAWFRRPNKVNAVKVFDGVSCKDNLALYNILNGYVDDGAKLGPEDIVKLNKVTNPNEFLKRPDTDKIKDALGSEKTELWKTAHDSGKLPTRFEC